MRGFFFLLLLTNVLFMGWKVWLAPESEEHFPYGGTLPVNQGLQLLSELDEGKAPPHRKLISVEQKKPLVPAVELTTPKQSEDVNMAASDTPPTSVICYQSSLLATVSDAKSLQQLLAKRGIKQSKRETVETNKANYWLMLKPYKSRAKANEAGEILKKKRVKDFFIVRSGSYENAVSLGVFSTHERAEQRYKEIVSLKARLRKPVIEAIELPAKRMLVKFRLDNENLPKGLLPMLDTSKQPHFTKTSCN
ncbi:MAG: SPOR domain-containing protein [Pseudomonadota bacterium]